LQPRIMTTPNPRALLLLNPGARSGADMAEAAPQALEAAGIETELLLARHDIPCEEAILGRLRARPGWADRIVVGGGDGTLNAAIPGLREAGLPFGILPLGTANDLARSLAIPTDLEAAARVIAEAAPRPLDLGEVNGHCYFNVASVGFSAELASELTASAKKRFGKLGYAVAAFGLLRRARPFTATLTHDGETRRIRTIQVSVGNGRHYGGGMTVSAEARPDDGLLDVYSLEVPGGWRLIALLPWLRRGTQGAWQEVRAFRTAGPVELRTRRHRPVNTDGELKTETPAVFRQHRAALRVFAPPG
jgi:YegS/Rv2252/BmrU family lipid kinase